MLKLLKSRPDLLKHFGVCFLLALFGTHGVVAGQAAGFSREWSNSQQPGNKWDWLDIVANVVGSAVGYGVHLLIVSL